MRLLPKDEGLGWTPYAFLAYLAFFLIGPALSARSNWPLTIAAVAVFLPLYFWCYWLTGHRKLIAIAGIAGAGPHRMPAALRRVDRLSRGAT